MMRSLLLMSFLLNLSYVSSIPQADDIFSAGLDEPDFDLDLLSSDELSPLEFNFNDLAENPDESIFSTSDEATIMDPFIVHADAHTASDNLLFDDGLVDLNQLQSLCGTEGSVSNDVLKARDDSSCPSTEGTENIKVPDLFQDSEAWWRKFPPQQNRPAKKQDATPLDSILRIFGGFGGGADCPPEYPIRCCTDLISGFVPSLYFIKPVDCITSMLPFPLSFGETPNVPKS